MLEKVCSRFSKVLVCVINNNNLLYTITISNAKLFKSHRQLCYCLKMYFIIYFTIACNELYGPAKWQNVHCLLDRVVAPVVAAIAPSLEIF